MSVSEMTKTRQYLAFSLADDLFPGDVARVREILELGPVPRVPGTPDAVRGMINVRGSVMPVLDMRTALGHSGREDTIETCIVVLEVEAGDQPLALGGIVDSVQEVRELSGEEVQAAPRIGSAVDASFIEGIGRRGKEFVRILGVDQMFGGSEVELARQTGAELQA